jgi:hypothetical protein
MPFMLVALLAIALLVTLAGFFLSFKPESRGAGAIAAGTRARRRLPDTEPVRNPRYRQAVTTGAMPRAARAMMICTPGFNLSLGRRGTDERIPWSVITIGLVSIFILGLFAFNAVFPRHAILVPTWFANSTQQQSQQQQQNSQPQQQFFGASKALQRISQLDPAQYNSTQDYNTWAYSACSAAAMTEVFDAYGRHYRITDVLKVEAAINEITPALGLVEDVGIQRTATLFGFNTNWGYSRSLDDVIAIANRGEPVIVSWPPYKYDGGHLLVVIGGNKNSVFLADSSAYNHKALTRAQFLNWWGGFSALVTPS